MVLLRAASAAFPGVSPGTLKLKARMLGRGLGMRRVLEPILAAPSGTALHRILAERPQMLGVLVWPYQSADWSAEQRLDRIAQHYAEIDALGRPFDFSVEERLVLADLGELRPGLALVLDQPGWFMREGGLTLNLFVDHFRAFSIAFSLFRDADGRRAVLIGGLQGRNTDGALDLYRALTKDLHGLRPRDVLLDVLRMLCRAIGVERILAVSDAARHHNHRFFGGSAKLTQDYDLVWEDRDGVRLDALTYELPLDPPRRDLADIKPNKRSMYRRRYTFLDQLEAQLLRDLPGLAPVRFADS